MTTLEELAQAIELGHPNETEELVRKALEEGTDPVELVEEVMVPAMRVVGEKYKEQQVDIPGILSSARSVQKGFEAVKEVKADYQTKEHGTIILGTIEGDLHDVGKNLVAMMFRGAGFKVIDLGVDISAKHRYKIMVGGGAVTRELAEKIGADGYTDNCVDAAEMARKFIL